MLRTGIAVALGCILASGIAKPGCADEIRIGHLETNDDDAINWLYYDCDRSSPLEMKCSVVQTFIIKLKSASEIDKETSEFLGSNPVAVFNKEFSDACKNMIPLEEAIRKGISQGRGLDGKPLKQRIVAAGSPMILGLIEACKSPSKDNVVAFFKENIDREKRSCKVHNDHSWETFAYDRQTDSWISREGPSGPCGTVTIGTLTQDPKNHFWSYVLRQLRLNPKGTALGRSCEAFPEYTYNYTWKTTQTFEGCDFIESMPD